MRNSIKNGIYWLGGVLAFAFSTLSSTKVYAQKGAPVKLELENPIEGADNLMELLGKIVDVAMFVAIPIIVLAVIYAGFLFVKAQGNTKELDDAKRTLLYVVIGAAIILGAKLLVEIISGTVAGLGG